MSKIIEKLDGAFQRWSQGSALTQVEAAVEQDYVEGNLSDAEYKEFSAYVKGRSEKFTEKFLK